MQKLYDSNDIQNILNRLTNDSAYKEKFMKYAKEYMSGSDYLALGHVISEGWYETFDRYDSDLCEQFLTIYERVE